MTYNEAKIIIEEILDVLIEIDNGTSREDLYLATAKLFKFRDEFLNPNHEKFN